MVKVIFYNLLRSKYRVKEEWVDAGSIHSILNQILSKYPNMSRSDFEHCVVFYQGRPIHPSGFQTDIADGTNIIITHFVGGG